MIDVIVESLVRLKERSRLRKLYFSHASRRQRFELEQYDRWLRRQKIEKELFA